MIALNDINLSKIDLSGIDLRGIKLGLEGVAVPAMIPSVLGSSPTMHGQ